MFKMGLGTQKFFGQVKIVLRISTFRYPHDSVVVEEQALNPRELGEPVQFPDLIVAQVNRVKLEWKLSSCGQHNQNHTIFQGNKYCR